MVGSLNYIVFCFIYRLINLNYNVVKSEYVAALYQMSVRFLTGTAIVTIYAGTNYSFINFDLHSLKSLLLIQLNDRNQ